MARICILLNGGIKYDQRVIKTIRTLSEKFKIDLFYINGSKEDYEIFNTNVILYNIVNEKYNNLKTQILRNSFFFFEFNYFINCVKKKNKKYDYIFEMDCDFSHNPNDLIRLYNACAKDGADLSIGSRYCKGGRVKNWPLKRILMSYFASVYVRIILWIGIKDTTAGFKCYRREVLEKINLDAVTFKGYAFQICMKYAAIKHGYKITEVPITFVDRLYGVSKMNSGIFKEAFFGVWTMKKMKL